MPIAPRMSTDSLYALRTAAVSGVGAAIASAWLVADDMAQGRLVHLAPHWRAAPLPVYLVYPQARFHPARLRRFLDVIRAGIGPSVHAAARPPADGSSPPDGSLAPGSARLVATRLARRSARS